jgi:hypothetical protein
MPVPDLSADGSSARHDEARLRNDRIARTARQNKFDRTIAVPFICECSEHRCEELIRVTLPEYTAAREAGDYLTAPGHQVENAEIIRVRECLWLYRAN